MGKNLNTIFPFYDLLSEQYRSQSDAIKLFPFTITPNTKLPNFIIRRTHNTGTVANLICTAVPVDASHVGDAVSIDAATYLHITSGTAYDHIWYAGATLGALLDPQDKGYYIHIEDEGATPHKHWYSEVFTVYSSVATMIQLTFKSDTELDGIGAGFYQNLYVNNKLKAPEYAREVTGDKRDGIVVKEKEVLMDIDILHILTAPEYIVSALMRLPMMDEVNVYIQDGSCLQPYEVRIEDPVWAEDLKGSVAKLKISFIDSIVIKKLNFREMGCNCTTSAPGTQISQSKGATITAGTPVDLVFPTPYANATYDFIVQGWDDEFNPLEITILAQNAAYLRVQSIVSGYVRVMALGTI